MKGSVRIPIFLALWGASLALAYWLGREQDGGVAREERKRVSLPSEILLSGGGFHRPEKSEEVLIDPDRSEESAGSLSAGRSVTAVINAMYEKATGGMMNPSRLVAVFAAIEEVPTEKMDEALRAIEALPDFEHKGLLYAAALARWGEGDGAAAADYVNGHFESDERPGLLGAVFSSWAVHDPGAAWDWFERVSASSDSDPKHFAPLMPHLFHALAAEDLGTAFERLDTLDSDELVKTALHGMAASLQSDQDRYAYLGEARALERQEDRVTAQHAVLGRWVKTDPAAATDWVERLPAGSERDEIAKGVADAWFGEAPEMAAEWYLAQVSEEAAPNAMSDIVKRWVRDDPNAAGNWLGQFEAGPQSNEARAVFSQSIVGIDPESAVQWSLSIEHPKMREKSLVNVYRQWQRREPETANEAIRQSSLPPEQVAKLLSLGAKR